MKFRYLASPFGPFIYRVRNRIIGRHRAILKILMYHNIERHYMSIFKRQIDFIANNYGFITPEDLPGFFDGVVKYNGIKILLTFDDAFKSNFDVAREILTPLGIRAIFFVCPSFIKIKNRHKQKEFISENLFNGKLKIKDIPDSFTPMDWNDIKTILADGHTIGAHTMNHRSLSDIMSESELRSEIIGCGNELEETLNADIQHFSFPFGMIENINENSMNIIRERYKYCYSAIRGMNFSITNPRAILRDVVSVYDPVGYVQIIVENGLGLLYKKQAMSLAAYATQFGKYCHNNLKEL